MFAGKAVREAASYKSFEVEISKTLLPFSLSAVLVLRFLITHLSVLLIFFTSALKSKLLAPPEFTFLCEFNLSAYKKKHVVYLCDESCLPQSVFSSVVCDALHMLWPLVRIPQLLLTAVILNFQIKIMISSVYMWFTDMQILTWSVALWNSVNKAVGVLWAVLSSNGVKGLRRQVRRLWKSRWL